MNIRDAKVDDGYAIQSFPKTVWVWYVFGKGSPDDPNRHLMIVSLPWEVPLWRRILTRVLLGSVWEREP